MEHAFPLRSVFIAIPLEGECKRRFQLLQEELKPFSRFLSFQNPLSPHLTLRFFREVMEIEYAPLVEKMREIAAKTESFDLNIVGPGAFGAKGNERVLHLEPEFSDPLARLSKRCPWPSDHPFSPHVTVARIRNPQEFAVHRKEIMKIISEYVFAVPVDRLRLYAEVNEAKQTPLVEAMLPEKIDNI